MDHRQIMITHVSEVPMMTIQNAGRSATSVNIRDLSSKEGQEQDHSVGVYAVGCSVINQSARQMFCSQVNFDA